MIRRRSRVRRIAKWTGLVVCVVIVAAWVVSLSRLIAYSFGFVAVGLVFGGLSIQPMNSGFVGFFQGRYSANYVLLIPQRQELTAPVPYPGVSIPLWIPFLLIAIPTVIAWRRGRPPPHGHCKNCGYDLTGNVSGRCPECGEAT